MLRASPRSAPPFVTNFQIEGNQWGYWHTQRNRLKDIPLTAMDAGGQEGPVCGRYNSKMSFCKNEIQISNHPSCKKHLSSHPH